jgi:hypothetical protein
MITGEGLSKEEATQETAKLLIAAFEEQIQKMVDARVAAERERHNALRQAVLNVLCDPEGRACFYGLDADRAVIDAAMKEGIK